MFDCFDNVGVQILAALLIAGLLILLFIYGGIYLLNYTGITARKTEWNSKVNNCIMNENYRKDCKLILYKDKQIHHHKNSTMVMPMPLVIYH